MKTKHLLINDDIVEVDLNVVYVIKSSDLIKVGVTNDMDRRFKQINGTRFDCELLYSSDYLINGYEVESKIHEQLISKRAHKKEWYHAEHLEEIMKIVKNTIGSIGVFEKDFQKPTKSQIIEYEKKSYDGMKQTFFEFKSFLNKDRSKDMLKTLAGTLSKVLEYLLHLETRVHCYNRKVYIDPQFLHDCIDDVDDVDEWDDQVIHKYGYTLLEDYLNWNVTDGLYFSTGMVKELCMLINNEKSITLRKDLGDFETVIRMAYPFYDELCDDCQEIV